MFENEYDITERLYNTYDEPSLYDRIMSYLSTFCAGMGFMAALIAAGIFWGARA